MDNYILISLNSSSGQKYGEQLTLSSYKLTIHKTIKHKSIENIPTVWYRNGIMT